MTSRINSGLISDSLMTSGSRVPRFGTMRSGLLCAAELRVVIAKRRFSNSGSCNIVVRMSIRVPFNPASKASSPSGKVYLIAWIIMARTDGLGSRRSF